ncbi:hypothetical protein O1Q96_29455 [Streptomyces sp. Qhu-G9]|uniref:hypothetical protein n=1 Tax=Streptomyces sp. Qhu-G9 TaxID=3452799 RepID=UPI0022AC168B|nr:hypothetical protein [Streptomyces aurantiacus]WAU83457.1 hypothetical protein O1Q96_29455 [Streptomyces aurantiacus]
MRALVSRGLLLPPLVCAALAFGPVASAAAVVDTQPGAAGSRVAELSLPPSDLTSQRLSLPAQAEHGDALVPLLAALTDLTERGNGPLGAAEAAEHARAVEAAAASLRLELRGTDRSAPSEGSADPVSDVVAGLQSALGGLLSSLTSLDVGGVVAAVPKVLTSLLGVLTGLLGGGLPKLPALPTP